MKEFIKVLVVYLVGYFIGYITNIQQVREMKKKIENLKKFTEKDNSEQIPQPKDHAQRHHL